MKQVVFGSLAISMDHIIACGNVGGLLVAPQMAGMVMPGDELAIGLAPQGDSGATGIALLRSVEGGTSSLRIGERARPLRQLISQHAFSRYRLR
jgi:hypothetical protein